jgi:hypothetical protein
MKSKNTLSGLLVLSLIFWATGPCASAEPDALSLKWYRDQKTNPTTPSASHLIELYLKGVGDGLLFANASMVFRRQQPLFCQPEELALHGSNFVDILERELKRTPPRGGPWRDDDVLPFILLHGLMNTFPCPQMTRRT